VRIISREAESSMFHHIECFARTGVNTPGNMFPKLAGTRRRNQLYLQAQIPNTKQREQLDRPTA
jgi:hypothetical protein